MDKFKFLLKTLSKKSAEVSYLKFKDTIQFMNIPVKWHSSLQPTVNPNCGPVIWMTIQQPLIISIMRINIYNKSLTLHRSWILALPYLAHHGLSMAPLICQPSAIHGLMTLQTFPGLKFR